MKVRRGSLEHRRRERLAGRLDAWNVPPETRRRFEQLAALAERLARDAQALHRVLEVVRMSVPSRRGPSAEAALSAHQDELRDIYAALLRERSKPYLAQEVLAAEFGVSASLIRSLVVLPPRR
jgi:hypothetical protein